MIQSPEILSTQDRDPEIADSLVSLVGMTPIEESNPVVIAEAPNVEATELEMTKQTVIDRELYKSQLIHGQGYMKLFREEELAKAQIKADSLFHPTLSTIEAVAESKQTIIEPIEPIEPSVDEAVHQIKRPIIVSDEKTSTSPVVNNTTEDRLQSLLKLVSGNETSSSSEDSNEKDMVTDAPGDSETAINSNETATPDDDVEQRLKRLQKIVNGQDPDEVDPIDDEKVPTPSAALELFQSKPEAKKGRFGSFKEAVNRRIFRRNRFLKAISDAPVKMLVGVTSRILYSKEKDGQHYSKEQQLRRRRVAKVVGAVAVTGVAVGLYHLFGGDASTHAHVAHNIYGTQTPDHTPIHWLNSPTVPNSGVHVADKLPSLPVNVPAPANVAPTLPSQAQSLLHAPTTALKETYSWTVANAVAPGHTTHILDQAAVQFNKLHGANYALTPHAGTIMFMDGSKAITPSDQLSMNEIILQMAG